MTATFLLPARPVANPPAGRPHPTEVPAVKARLNNALADKSPRPALVAAHPLKLTVDHYSWPGNRSSAEYKSPAGYSE